LGLLVAIFKFPFLYLSEPMSWLNNIVDKLSGRSKKRAKAFDYLQKELIAHNEVLAGLQETQPTHVNITQNQQKDYVKPLGQFLAHCSLITTNQEAKDRWNVVKNRPDIKRFFPETIQYIDDVIENVSEKAQTQTGLDLFFIMEDERSDKKPKMAKKIVPKTKPVEPLTSSGSSATASSFVSEAEEEQSEVNVNLLNPQPVTSNPVPKVEEEQSEVNVDLLNPQPLKIKKLVFGSTNIPSTSTKRSLFTEIATKTSVIVNTGKQEMGM
jgi:hypothetical protein